MNIEQIDYSSVIHNLKQKLETVNDIETEALTSIQEGKFPHLLAALPSILSGYDIFEDKITSREDLAEYLNNRFQITDKKTAIEAIRVFLFENTQLQYEQFKSFWDGNPVFELKDLEEKSKDYFEKCMDFAHQFSNIVNELGFAAFDYGEAIRMAKECYSIGYLEQEDYNFMINDIANRAFRQFDSFEEYAISYLCGGTYFIYYSSGLQKEYADNMFQTLFGGISELFFKHEQIWKHYTWPTGKKYFPKLRETRKLIEDTKGCLVSDRISIDGCPIGCMTRVDASEGNPDSGWQFFSGDESQEYMEDLTHVQVFSLNTLCNYDNHIIEHLQEPTGSTLSRMPNGTFQKVN